MIKQVSKHRSGSLIELECGDAKELGKELRRLIPSTIYRCSNTTATIWLSDRIAKKFDLRVSLAQPVQPITSCQNCNAARTLYEVRHSLLCLDCSPFWAAQGHNQVLEARHAAIDARRRIKRISGYQKAVKEVKSWKRTLLKSSIARKSHKPKIQVVADARVMTHQIRQDRAGKAIALTGTF